MFSPKSHRPTANVKAKTEHEFDEKEILAAEAEAEALEAVAAEAAAEAEALAAVAAREEALQKQNAINEARKNVGAELVLRMKEIQAKTAAAATDATNVVEATKEMVPVANKLALPTHNVNSKVPLEFLAELALRMKEIQAKTAAAATDATNVVEATKEMVPVANKLALPTQNVNYNVPPEFLAELKKKLNAMRVEETREAEFDKRMMMNANTSRLSASRSTTMTQDRIERSRRRFPDDVLDKTYEKKKGGIATRKKYRRRNKRKTKHYKKKAKCYTKKRNRRY